MVEKVASNIIFQLWNKKDYNVMIDGRKFLDQATINDLKTYANIRKLLWNKVMITQLDAY